MTYDTKSDKQNRVKIKWTHRRGANLKNEIEKVDVYDDTAKEDYLQTLAEYQEILVNYPNLQVDEQATVAWTLSLSMYEMFHSSNTK